MKSLRITLNVLLFVAMLGLAACGGDADTPDDTMVDDTAQTSEPMGTEADDMVDDAAEDAAGAADDAMDGAGDGGELAGMSDAEAQKALQATIDDEPGFETVTVTYQANLATLTGTVVIEEMRTHAEKMMIEAGVQRVQNDITVE